MKWKRMGKFIFGGCLVVLAGIVTFIGVKKYTNDHSPSSHEINDDLSIPPSTFRNMSTPFMDKLFVEEMRSLLNTFKYNSLVSIAPHNSYSSRAHGYIIDPQQYVSMYRQLAEYSARSIDLDLWLYDNEIRLCHSECGSNTMNLVRPLGKSGESATAFLRNHVFKFLNTTKSQSYLTLAESQNIIRGVLESSPPSFRAEDIYELIRRPPILTIIFENYVSNGTLIDTMIEQSGLSSFIFTPDEYKRRGNTWPIFTEMIMTNKVVVILSDSYTKYTFNAHDMFKETNFPRIPTFDSTVPVADICGTPLRGRGDDMLLVHYYPQVTEGNDFHIINSNFPQFFEKCLFSLGMNVTETIPNIVKADMIHQGTLFEKAITNLIDKQIKKIFSTKR